MYQRLLAIACDNKTVAHARGLPADFYTSPIHFEDEKKRIFYRSWICVGHVCMAGAPGDYFVANVVDQEVLVVRNTTGVLNAFFNACRHRGHPVADGTGTCERLTCPYHAWSYDLDGRLVKAPHAGRVPTFDPDQVSLVRVQIATLAGAIFVNLDPTAAPLEEVFAGVETEILAYKSNVAEQKLVYDRPLAHHCNWKASVEGFSECYHCGPVHGYLSTNIIDPDSYQISAQALVQRHQVAARGSDLIQRLWLFWPNTAMGLYPIPGVGLVWCLRHMYPVSHDQTIYHYRWFADIGGQASTIQAYASNHAQTVGAEDAQIASGVQRGMQSLGFEQAQLLCTPANGVSSEHLIKYFHDLVTEAMAEAPATTKPQ